MTLYQFLLLLAKEFMRSIAAGGPYLLVAVGVFIALVYITRHRGQRFNDKLVIITGMVIVLVALVAMFFPPASEQTHAGNDPRSLEQPLPR